MINEIIFVFWFFLPAGLANMSAFLAGKVPFLKPFNYPVDFNKKFRGKRILGSNKTIRGFVFGIIAGVLLTFIQKILFQNFLFIREFVHVDYNSFNPIVFGSLAGFGALWGDSIKSFFKRQIGIDSGKSWYIFDNIDYIVGGILFTSFYIRLDLTQYFLLFVVWFLIHPAINFVAYVLRLKDSPF